MSDDLDALGVAASKLWNVGRGMQLFYETFDGRSNLAVGGRLDTPEFYIFPDSKKETAWNFEYDDISELAA